MKEEDKGEESHWTPFLLLFPLSISPLLCIAATLFFFIFLSSCSRFFLVLLLVNLSLSLTLNIVPIFLYFSTCLFYFILFCKFKVCSRLQCKTLLSSNWQNFWFKYYCYKFCYRINQIFNNSSFINIYLMVACQSSSWEENFIKKVKYNH